MSKPAVVLLSGGLDSSTVVAMAQQNGYDVHALSFSYGQRHTVELESARAVAAAAGITDHRVIDIDLGAFGGSALTDTSIDVPKHDSPDEAEDGIPVTYVPARNTIFLSFALAFAEVIGSSDIFIGVNAMDYSGYPDCRPEFVAAFQDLARIATRTGVEGSTQVTIHAPLMAMTKAQISAAGTELGVNYSITTSCYDADDQGRACGRCDACHLRHQGFVQAGLADPTRYQPGVTPT